jgi:beta-glucanase (GH16 family)
VKATSGLVCLLIFSAGTGLANAAGWKLVWSDEFDGPAGAAPNPSKWTYDLGGGGWGNDEEEDYRGPGPNVFLDGQGNLVIRALRVGGKWTSARVKTQGREAVQYGRVEARMKLPTGAGVWPAFWMLGDDIEKVGWPACGEIDIMEWVPKYGRSTSSSTLHGPISKGKGIGSTYTFPNGGSVDDGFHTYGMIRSKDQLAFYRDDWQKPYFEVTKKDLPAGDWKYDHPFFVILNLAIGGKFPGPPDRTTPDPSTMLVDYVRVYK